MKIVTDIPVLENIPVLVRAPLNVPIENGKVTNDYRLRKAVTTVNYLRGKGARVILISHIGEQGTETLEPVAEAFGRLVPGVSFCRESIGPAARAAIRELRPGGTLVLENLRRHKGERMNDGSFAAELAALADVFVQDSFDTCHRLHASIVSVPKLLPSYAGLELADEVAELRQALTPKRPAFAVIGGAKFSTKEAVLTSLIEDYDHVFVGGALANDFLKAQGYGVGKSLTSPEVPKHLLHLLDNPRLVLPIDCIVVPASEAMGPKARQMARVASLGQVNPDDIILDHGPGTSALLANLAGQASAVLWNGPLGNYECGFTDATLALARAISASNAHSVVGGGDTIAAIEDAGLLSCFSFISIGGGAMLEYLARGSLPGIDALER
ncbi:MAG TPA: phosphoglycerate kinase [Candidatus Paceibacterota bacterium]|nr:phosphoglycerate kinase [Candidatus Paceibacterota bacterium]